MLEIIKINTKAEIKIIERLAYDIFHEVYDPIIPSEHTDYFLDRFQSETAIRHQLENESFYYYLLKFDLENIGYLGIQLQGENMILSKLYILKAYRGREIGKAALEFVNRFALDNGINKIELVVNQGNRKAIDIYLKNGYVIVESQVKTFPNGQTILDYKMEKRFLV